MFKCRVEMLKLASFVLELRLQPKRFREFSEIYQVLKQTFSCLTLLPHLNKNETNFHMQSRTMSLVGITRSLLGFVGACAAANILLHVNKHVILDLRTCYLAERHMFDCTPTKHCGFSFLFYLHKCVLLQPVQGPLSLFRGDVC